MEHLSPSKENAWQRAGPSTSPTKASFHGSPIKGSKSSMMKALKGSSEGTSKPRFPSPTKSVAASPTKPGALGDKSNHRGMQSPTKPGAPGHNPGLEGISEDMLGKSPMKSAAKAQSSAQALQQETAKSVSPSKSRSRKGKAVASFKAQTPAVTDTQQLSDGKYFTTPPALAHKNLVTPAANIGRAGLAKYRRAEAQDAALGFDLEHDSDQTVEGQEPELTEEQLYPEIEYMPPSETAKNPPYYFPEELDGYPRAKELVNILKDIPLHGYVSHEQAQQDRVERSRFKIDLDHLPCFDDFAQRLEDVTNTKAGAGCKLLDREAEDREFFGLPPLAAKSDNAQPTKTSVRPAAKGSDASSVSKLSKGAGTSSGRPMTKAAVPARRPISAATSQNGKAFTPKASAVRGTAGPARTLSTAAAKPAGLPKAEPRPAGTRIVVNRAAPTPAAKAASSWTKFAGKPQPRNAGAQASSARPVSKARPQEKDDLDNFLDQKYDDYMTGDDHLLSI